ncbi:zinc transporter ZIP1-like [Macrosteles quadrilineatus]|uniref:zinc transporter ZIP1-like n=1 Tax=Macrosteles quadrilineatus TaxID=74068 RepID=UPI0023E1B43F|nr:zinc transporter ZIP1-like [Macrosteles quadrilineatus]XP_054285378.1 zinc transporter ZIP1-like [Macrosteles quadrilineatus]
MSGNSFSLGNISSETWTVTTKCAFVTWLFLLTVMFALLPMAIVKSYRTERDADKRTRYSRLIGMLNCFAGGVFLGTALLHLLPNVMKLLSQLKGDTNFPVAEFTVALGFLVVLVMEQIGLACKEQEVDTMSPIERLSQPVLHSEILSLRADEVRACPELPTPIQQEPTSHLRSVLLLATLSIHSVFEGLAIGLQTDLDSVLNIFVAVMVHKVIVSFSVGLSLLQSQLRLVAVVALDVLFALMSPLGMVVGLYVDTLHSVRQQLFSGMLQGIACGTFLYITCFEVLPRELSQGRDRLLKLLLLIVGFSSTVGVVFMDKS